MKEITLLDTTVYLITSEPNWAVPVDCKFSILSDTDRSITGVEHRQAFSHSLRTSMVYEAMQLIEEAAAFRVALKEMGDAPVLCPFWPAVELYGSGDKAGLVSGYRIVYEPDWSSFEIYEQGEAPSIITPSANALDAPLLWGRFGKAPEPEAQTDELSTCTIDFVDDSPLAFALHADSQTFHNGPDAITMFPTLPNWTETVAAGRVEDGVDTSTIGYRRESAKAYYDQPGIRKIDQTFACAGWEAILKMIRFFYDKKGAAGSFWLPSAVGACALTATGVEGANSITVDEPEGLGDDTHLALIRGTRASGFTIDEVTGNTIALTELLDRDYPPLSSVVSPLILSRFESTSIEVSFITDILAVMDSSFIEATLSNEATSTAFLYSFILEETTWRFTSHENDVSAPPDLYLSRPFEHEEVTDSINFEHSDLHIQSRHFWSETEIQRNPLSYFLPMKLEEPMRVEIGECLVSADGDIVGAIVPVFKGRVSSVSSDGPFIKASCVGRGVVFERAVPSLLIQPTCNYFLYSTPCGIDRDEWRIVADSSEEYTGGYTIQLLNSTMAFDGIPPAADPTFFEHFFAGGKIQVGNEVRSILDSTTFGEYSTITIRYQFTQTFAVGESVLLWPGCDGRKQTCLKYHETNNPEGKFDNFAHFGGFPHAPIGNPTVAKVMRDHSQGGKK